MAYNNTVRVTLKVRNDLAANWANNNPILAQGEFGLENNSFLIKVGDGATAWNSLPYINKLDPNYLHQGTDGTITFSSDFYALIQKLVTTDGGQTITGPVQIDYGRDSFNRPNSPSNDLDIANKYYVDKAVALAGHLSKLIVTNLPSVNEADAYTIYMIKDNSATGADKYKEYMLIGGELVQIGDTSIDLKNLVTGNTTENHLVSIAADGSLVDSGIATTEMGALVVATASALGGVKSGSGVLGDGGTGVDRVVVDNSGFMTLSHVSTSLLYVPTGDTLILEGGNSGGGIVSG